jgi:hypothetical protein
LYRSFAVSTILLEKRNRQSAAYLKFIFLTIQIFGCLDCRRLCKTGRKNRYWREGMESKEITRERGNRMRRKDGRRK